jgi:hypothetical protein
LLEGSNRRGRILRHKAPKKVLLLNKLGFAYVRKKPGMRRAAVGVVAPRLLQAEGAVHRVPDIGGVRIFLTIILPPANRA